MKRLGGNFTQPEIDFSTSEIHYQVFVDWVRQATTYDDELDARQELLATCGERRPIIPIGVAA